MPIVDWKNVKKIKIYLEECVDYELASRGLDSVTIEIQTDKSVIAFSFEVTGSVYSELDVSKTKTSTVLDILYKLKYLTKNDVKHIKEHLTVEEL